MEEYLQFETKDNKTVYGTLNYQDKKHDKLIIFVHGLTGSPNEHHYFNAVPFFNSQGFDTFRFAFYSRKDNARQLSECSLQTHVDDLNLVLNSLDYKTIFLVGHSLGCSVIAKSNLGKINGMVLWEPTAGLRQKKATKISFNEALGKYILHWGREAIISRQMHEDWKNLSEDYFGGLSVPFHVIFGRGTPSHKKWGSRFPNATVIERASHGFIEEGTEVQLFAATLKWLNSQAGSSQA